MFEQLGLTAPAPLSAATLLVNILLGATVSFALSWHYRRFGRTFSNRPELAWVFPLIVMVTILLISVVKSSLALSLGLVGALSIVRFRTAIKEPEELAYLFMAIAIGLGFGADQRLTTLIAAAEILGILMVRWWMVRSKEEGQNLYLNIEALRPDDETNMLEKLSEVLSRHVLMADMRRVDMRDGSFQATYYIDCKNSQSLTGLMDSLNRDLPGASISFVEQRGIPRG